jgi:hypothetical protein
VRITSLPATAEKVLAAIKSKRDHALPLIETRSRPQLGR